MATKIELNIANAIPGYDSMTPAEQIAALTKLGFGNKAGNPSRTYSGQETPRVDFEARRERLDALAPAGRSRHTAANPNR